MYTTTIIYSRIFSIYIYVNMRVERFVYTYNIHMHVYSPLMAGLKKKFF